MAIKTGDRHSRLLFPPSLDELVDTADPVRVYDAFVDGLDMASLGFDMSESRVGAPVYDPRSMLKLLVYGYSYGIRSSRKLEQACYHNVSFIWLVGGIKPDHKTISEFRRAHKKRLKGVLRQCVQLCIKLDLIAGHTLFVDGSAMRANASIGKNWSEEKYKKFLSELDERLNLLLAECESQDKSESDFPSLIKLEKELRSKEALRSRVEKILSEFETSDAKTLNLTDKESVISKSRQGTHACFNSQIVTDDKNGLIVNSDAVSRSNDTSEFSTQITQAEDVLDKECQVCCADSGYSQLEDLSKIAERGTEVIVPNQKQASRKEVGAFDKSRFKYNGEKDEYICPAGNRLPFYRDSKTSKGREYRMKDFNVCLNCHHYGVCTEAKRGRSITRIPHEELKKTLENKYESKEGQDIYGRRKIRAEVPFGYIKRVMEAGYFLLRGREGARGELTLLCNGYNLKRMMQLIGIPQLLGILRGSEG